MNSKLQLIKSESFGELQCDFYKGGKEYYMTREQIGMALEYADPQDSIRKIHERNNDRLNQYSVQVKLTATDGKKYNTTVYTRKGVMEICRFSRQPKADAFMDFVWDIMDGLMTGGYKLTDKSKRLDIQEKNARAKTASLYMRIAENSALPDTYRGVFLSYASKELSGQEILPLPSVERKTYTATQLGDMFGISSKKIGSLANKNNLKTSEYGLEVWDKSPYSAKDTQAR